MVPVRFPLRSACARRLVGQGRASAGRARPPGRVRRSVRPGHVDYRRSVVAFLRGQLIDVAVFHRKIRRATGEKQSGCALRVRRPSRSWSNSFVVLYRFRARPQHWPNPAVPGHQQRQLRLQDAGRVRVDPVALSPAAHHHPLPRQRTRGGAATRSGEVGRGSRFRRHCDAPSTPRLRAVSPSTGRLSHICNRRVRLAKAGMTAYDLWPIVRHVMRREAPVRYNPLSPNRLLGCPRSGPGVCMTAVNLRSTTLLPRRGHCCRTRRLRYHAGASGASTGSTQVSTAKAARFERPVRPVLGKRSSSSIRCSHLPGRCALQRLAAGFGSAEYRGAQSRAVHAGGEEGRSRRDAVSPGRTC